ncbi:hypothetical protein VTO73DRAFT_5607 [Trametes versicolor]
MHGCRQRQNCVLRAKKRACSSRDASRRGKRTRFLAVGRFAFQAAGKAEGMQTPAGWMHATPFPEQAKGSRNGRAASEHVAQGSGCAADA